MTITKDLIELQSNGVGSGDAGGVLGISPFKNQTPLQIYMRKRGELPKIKDNPAMRFGRLVEGGILTAFEEDSGLAVKRFKHPDDLLRHARHRFMVAMLDGMVTKVSAVVEAKSTANRDEWGEPFSADIPDHYFAQVQHEIAVADAKLAFVPVIFLKSREITFYRVQRDDKFIRNLIECERDFWINHVLAGVPPKMISAADVEARWRNGTSGRVMHSGHALAREVLALKQQAERVDQAVEAVERRRDDLRLRMADAEVLLFHGKPIVTFRYQQSQRVDIDRLKTKHPAIYRKVLKTSSSRVLRIK